MRTLENRLARVKAPRSSSLLIGYIICCVGISACSLGTFAQLVKQYLTVHYCYMTEAIIVTGQVGFQWLFMFPRSWEERARYMLIALTVSMIGSLMLLPILVYSSVSTVSPPAAAVYFFVVVGIIFLIHHRLIIRHSLPKILAGTWVLYRILLLLFVTFSRTT